MHRRSRRVSQHPRYARGARLSAEEVRRARSLPSAGANRSPRRPQPRPEVPAAQPPVQSSGYSEPAPGSHNNQQPSAYEPNQPINGNGSRRLSAAEIRQARQAKRTGQEGAGESGATAASDDNARWSREGSSARHAVPVRSGRTAPRRTIPGQSNRGPAGSGGGSGRPPSGPVPPVAVPAPEPSGKRHWSRRRKVILSTVGIFLIAILSIGGVLAYKANRAYQSIFIQSPPRPIVTTDASGKQIIVDAGGGSSDKTTASAHGQTAAVTHDASAPTPTPIPDWTGKNRVNILLLGVDTSADRAASGEPPLSDTIIVLSIDPNTKKIGMMSLPRDMLVSIPGYGDAKINAAYSDGSLTKYTGPGLVRATIENDFHIPINYFAVVDFQGFQKIINTLGGVVIDVPAPIKDDQYPGVNFNYTRIYFHSGLQHMDGATALNYVRTRHDDNDFARGLRQQQLLEALRAQATAFNLISKAPSLIDELGNTIKTDMPPSDALRLAKLLSETNTSDIKSYSLLPALTEQWNPGEPYYLIPDWSKVSQIVNQLISPVSPATPASQAAASPSATAEQPDLQSRVLVENGTFIDQLAANAAAKLSGDGFLNVSTQQSPNAGNQAHSEIINYTQNEATSHLIAQTLALPQTDIQQGDPSQANGYGVVVILGNDAPHS